MSEYSQRQTEPDLRRELNLLHEAARALVLKGVRPDFVLAALASSVETVLERRGFLPSKKEEED